MNGMEMMLRAFLPKGVDPAAILANAERQLTEGLHAARTAEARMTAMECQILDCRALLTAIAIRVGADIPHEQTAIMPLQLEHE